MQYTNMHKLKIPTNSQDLRSGQSHYLGIHDKCDSSWCSVKASNHPSNKSHVMYHQTFCLNWNELDRIVSKAVQLIQDQTTNLSECYMPVRAKMDGGKQINHIQFGSFQHRCMAAGLRTDTGTNLDCR